MSNLIILIFINICQLSIIYEKNKNYVLNLVLILKFPLIICHHYYYSIIIKDLVILH